VDNLLNVNQSGNNLNQRSSGNQTQSSLPLSITFVRRRYSMLSHSQFQTTVEKTIDTLMIPSDCAEMSSEITVETI